jgi:NAD(P)-dependent dehydrogenase (short-subunit alcohol dehydrogenase family)
MSQIFAGKVFIVTGAASGIGLDTAKTILAKGASVSACDINFTALQSVFPLDHPHLYLSSADISSRSSINTLLTYTKKRFSHISGIASIAGTGGHKLGLENIWETSDTEFSFLMDVNVRGCFNILSENLKPGVMEDGVSIVHITSMFSERGFPKRAVFAASKHAAI